MRRNRRILIFNVNWLGDVLFSTAVIRNIRQNYSEGFIACVVPVRCYPILEGNPHLDEIIVFDEKKLHRGVMEKLKFIRMLKGKRFDTVFLLHRSFTRALISRLAGIPERIGYHTRKRAFLLTKNIKPPKMDSLHRIDYYLDIVEKAGLEIRDRHPEFFLGDNDAKAVDLFLQANEVKQSDFLIGINPGGNWLPKRWPVEYWTALADKLISELGVKVIITGSSSDIALARSLREKMKNNPIMAVAELNIKQLGALCRRLNLFITSDTGPLHIANAAGARRIIALFGPTHPGITGPVPAANTVILRKDVGCQIPCYEVDCPDNRCMKVIAPEDVFKEVTSFICQTTFP